MTKEIQWYYHRKNCTSCTKALSYMQENNIELPELVIANKVKFNRSEALKMIRKHELAKITRGQKVMTISIGNSTDDELATLALGRSGTLRAPAFVSGNHFMVGFNSDAYDAIFNQKSQ